MSPRTKQNLNTAMRTEAFTHAEYLRFAAHARVNENWALAQLFRVTADTDRTEHFAKEADLAGLAARDADNLRHAVEEKRAEAAMYKQFAKEATADADFFRSGTLRRDAGGCCYSNRGFRGRFPN